VAGDRLLLCFYHILINYGSSNVDMHKISTGGKVHFSLPFLTYFSIESKREFGTARVEKGVEDNFTNKHPILIK
jgi:hypothetical protein